MAVARGRAIKTMDRQRGNPDLAMGRVVWPDDAAKRAANFRNQLELPVLFYVVVAFALITKGADTLDDRAGLAVRSHPADPCRDPRRTQQGQVAHAGLRVRLPDS